MLKHLDNHQCYWELKYSKETILFPSHKPILLEKFGLQDANPVTTPLDLHIKMDDIDEETDFNNEGENNLISHGYATLIGSIMYLAHGTDIAYTAHKLAQYTSNPKRKHWTAIK